MNSIRNISVPEDLCQAAEQRFIGRIASIDELVANILRELLRDDVVSMDEKEIEIIEERLRGLGYV